MEKDANVSVSQFTKANVNGRIRGLDPNRDDQDIRNLARQEAINSFKGEVDGSFSPERKCSVNVIERSDEKVARFDCLVVDSYL